eukprot:SM000012S25423  [mRNA]  locus=s12:1055551:1057913:+ [translate_table: standard]
MPARMLEVTVGSTAALKESRSTNRQDPYAVLRLGDAEFSTNSSAQAGARPVWNHRFQCILPEDPCPQELEVEIWDKPESGGGPDKFIGSCKVDLSPVYAAGDLAINQAVLRRSGKLLGHVRFYFQILVEYSGEAAAALPLQRPAATLALLSAGQPPSQVAARAATSSAAVTAAPAAGLASPRLPPLAPRPATEIAGSLAAFAHMPDLIKQLQAYQALAQSQSPLGSMGSGGVAGGAGSGSADSATAATYHSTGGGGSRGGSLPRPPSLQLPALPSLAGQTSPLSSPSFGIPSSIFTSPTLPLLLSPPSYPTPGATTPGDYFRHPAAFGASSHHQDPQQLQQPPLPMQQQLHLRPLPPLTQHQLTANVSPASGGSGSLMSLSRASGVGSSSPHGGGPLSPLTVRELLLQALASPGLLRGGSGGGGDDGGTTSQQQGGGLLAASQLASLSEVFAPLRQDASGAAALRPGDAGVVRGYGSGVPAIGGGRGSVAQAGGYSQAYREGLQPATSQRASIDTVVPAAPAAATSEGAAGAVQGQGRGTETDFFLEASVRSAAAAAAARQGGSGAATLAEVGSPPPPRGLLLQRPPASSTPGKRKSDLQLDFSLGTARADEADPLAPSTTAAQRAEWQDGPEDDTTSKRLRTGDQ